MKICDLGQPLYAGMPHFPTHPPLAMTLNKMHGDFVLENGASSAAETITLGGHVGTHIDALSHFSCEGSRTIPSRRSVRSGGAECCLMWLG